MSLGSLDVGIVIVEADTAAFLGSCFRAFQRVKYSMDSLGINMFPSAQG